MSSHRSTPNGTSLLPPNCSFLIELEQNNPKVDAEVIEPGVPIRGKVVVVITKRGLVDTEIKIHFLCQERVSRHHNPDPAFHLVSDIYKDTRLLRKRGSGAELLPGRWTYPFEFPLPGNLPKSMAATQPHNGRVSITYRLTVEMTNLWGTRENVAGQVLQLKPFPPPPLPHPHIVIPARVAPQMYPIRAMGVARGYIATAANVVDTQVNQESDIQVYLACHNASTASIRVHVALENEVLSRKYGTSRVETVFKEQVQLPRLKQRKPDALPGRLPESVVQDLSNQLHNNQNLFSFQIPRWCRDSYESTMIHAKHSLVISFATNFFVSDLPRIIVPLQIGTSAFFDPNVRRQEVQSTGRVTTSAVVPVAVPIESPIFPHTIPIPNVVQPTSCANESNPGVDPATEGNAPDLWC